MRFQPSIALLFFVLVTSYVTGQHLLVEEYYPTEDDSKKLYKQYFVKTNDPEVKDSSFIQYYQDGGVNFKGQFENNRAVGKWSYYFQNGKLMREVALDTEQDGFWYYFFENENPRMKGRVTEGKKEGRWVYYYEKGAVKDSGSYVNGNKNGEWVYFFEDGIRKASALYENGSGEYTEYFYNGKVKMRGPIRDNVSEGKWTYYYRDGAVKAEGFEFGGVKNGYWKYFYSDGTVSSEGNYAAGKQEGEWKYFYENGQLSQEGEHKNGFKDKYWKLYHIDGGFKAEGNFSDGNGKYTEYYPNGNKKVVGQFIQDKQDSTWVYYYEDGTVEGECKFFLGQGKYVGRYKNGNKKMEGVIRDGKKTGVWVFYDENGDTAGYHTTLYNKEDAPVFGLEQEAISELDTAMTSSVKGDNAEKVDTAGVATGKLPERFKNPNKQPIRKAIRSFPPFDKPNWEFHGTILSANPLALLANQLPGGIEFYWQERLGYEVTYNFLRRPFLTREENIQDLANFERGWSVSFTQRFYRRKRDHGMLYWGQQVRYKTSAHLAKLDEMDPDVPNDMLRLDIQSYEFALIGGNRLISDVHRGGLTFDIYAGIGIGYQMISRNFDQGNETYKSVFQDIKQSEIIIPVRFGFSFGYIFGDNG